MRRGSKTGENGRKERKSEGKTLCDIIVPLCFITKSCYIQKGIPEAIKRN